MALTGENLRKTLPWHAQKYNYNYTSVMGKSKQTSVKLQCQQWEGGSSGLASD